jgi:hypothetical protein
VSNFSLRYVASYAWHDFVVIPTMLVQKIHLMKGLQGFQSHGSNSNDDLGYMYFHFGSARKLRKYG